MSALDSVMELLRSNDFRCTAHKYDEEISGDGERVPFVDGWDEVLGEQQGPYQGTYDENDRCTAILTVEIEREYGEMGSILCEYPVVCGECASYHGYQYNEGDVYDKVMLRYSERKHLLRKADQLLKDESKVAVGPRFPDGSPNVGLCPLCDGTGLWDSRMCQTCGGSGKS